MLFIFSFVLTLFTAIALGYAAEQPKHTEDLQFILDNNFLLDEDTDKILYFLAETVLQENNSSSLTVHELVQKFHEIATTQEIKDKYLAIYDSYFNDEEVKQVCGLLQNEAYLKYRKKLLMANHECWKQTDTLMEELSSRDVGFKQPKADDDQLQPIHITKDNYQSILNSNHFVIIDVYTDWCGPCKYLAPIFKECFQEYGHLYQFAKLNAEEQKALAKQFQIKAFPTILFFKDGKEIGREVGFMPKNKLVAKINNYFQ